MDILLVENDVSVAQAIVATWPVPGDQIRHVPGYRQCLHIIHTAEIDFFDAAIVEVNLSDGNGLEILRTIRSRSDIPLVLISGVASPESRASAMDSGADDYVMKPFSVRELQARINRIAAKKRSNRKVSPTNFRVGDVVYMVAERRLEYGKATVFLTDLEARLLLELQRNIGRECTKSILSKNACFREYDPRDKTIDVYMARLRKKVFGLHPESANVFQTIRGIGYRLIPRESGIDI